MLARASSGTTASDSPELTGPKTTLDLLALRELGRSVHRLGRIALGVADDQLDLPAVDAAGRVDLLHRQLDAAIDADPGGRRGAGERRQIADLDRLFCRDRGLG